LTALTLAAGSLLLVALLGPDDGTAAEQSSTQALRRGEQLEQLSRVAVARSHLKYDIARAAIDRRLTLLEAAECYRAINRSWTRFQADEHRRLYPGNTDVERHCREVIRWVHRVLQETNPSLSQALVTQLEEELQAHLRSGFLRLPDGDS
jgi:hypothetical protein